MDQRYKTYMKLGASLLIFVGIIGYSLYQARHLIEGPQITLTNPENGATLTDPLVHFSGSAQNITYISLNNQQIYVDGNGTFNEDLLLAPGYNDWRLEARDKFGRTTEKNIELIFKKS